MYTSMIMSFFSHLRIRMYTLALIEVKPIFQKNLVIILFQSLLAYFKLYRLFSILQTSFFQLAKHFYGIFM